MKKKSALSFRNGRKKHGLQTKTDKVGNVLIKVPATAGL